jgi:hypothetical protein
VLLADLCQAAGHLCRAGNAAGSWQQNFWVWQILAEIRAEPIGFSFFLELSFSSEHSS